MTSCYCQNDLYDTHAVHMGRDLHYWHANEQQRLERFDSSRRTQEYKSPPIPFLDEESMTCRFPIAVDPWTLRRFNIRSSMPDNAINQSSRKRCLAYGDVFGHQYDLLQTLAADHPHRVHTPYQSVNPMVENVATPDQNAEDPIAEEGKPTKRNWNWSKAGKVLLKVAVAIGSIGGLAATLWQGVEST